MSHKKAGYLYALLAAVFFASIAILGKQVIQSGVNSIELMLWQYLFTLIMLATYLLIRQPKSLKVSKSELKRLALLGLIGSASTNLFFYLALNYLSAGMSSMLLFTNPIFITLYMWLSRSKTISRMNWIAMLMAFVGCLLVLDLFSGVGALAPIVGNELPLDGNKFPIDGAKAPIGIGLGLLSGLCYAFYNVFADLKLKELDPNVINLYGSGFAIILPISLFIIQGQPLRVLTLHQYGLIWLLAGAAGILPIFFIFKAIRFIGSEKASVIATMELPLTVLMAAVFLKESMNVPQIMGIVLISAAGLLLHRSDHKRSEQS